MADRLFHHFKAVRFQSHRRSDPYQCVRFGSLSCGTDDRTVGDFCCIFTISQKETEYKKNAVIWQHFFGLGYYIYNSNSPYGNRTRVSAVRGRRLNRLTNEPCIILSYTILFVKYFFHIFIFILPELEELAFDLGDIVPSFIVLASFLLFLYFCKCLIKWLEYLVKLRSILWILLCDFSTHRLLIAYYVIC